MADKKLVALEIKDAREAGYAAVWDLIQKHHHPTTAGVLWMVWRAMYAYQEATERALLGDDAEPSGDR